MNRIKFHRWGASIALAVFMLPLFFVWPIDAAGEDFEYISETQIVISGGDADSNADRPFRLIVDSGFPQVGPPPTNYGNMSMSWSVPPDTVFGGTFYTGSGDSRCWVSVFIRIDPSDPGSAQIDYGRYTGDIISAPGDPLPCPEDRLSPFSDGSIAIDTTNIDEGTVEEPAQRVALVSSYAEDFENPPARDTITLEDSTGTVLQTLNTTLVTSSDPDISTNQYQQIRFQDVEPGTYRFCSVAANTCTTATKVQFIPLTGVEIGESVRIDLVGEVRVSVRVNIINPPDGYVTPPIEVEIRETQPSGIVAEVADTFVVQNSPYYCVREYGACTTAERDVTLTLNGSFVGIEPGDYQMCIVTTDECVDFTKPADDSVSVVIVASNSAALTELQPPEEPDPNCDGSVIIGWIVCPIATFLLETLDNYARDGVVRSILNFDALDEGTGTRAALESIWSGFRGIANVGFVIAFFVVVYSAVSGGFISAYDIRKLLPKIVIGAIMVQLSFFISTQLVVIFNAMGESIVEIMLRPIGIDTSSGAVNAIFDESAIDYGVLGGILAGLVSAIIVLLIIIGLFMSIIGIVLMVVVFIMRNVVLVVLTAISPIAFVTWILPNTENIFKRWWTTYIQLLALFPIAMAFLASGRLVSYVWTQGNPASYVNQWLGLIALFAPYLLAPKLFAFAGAAMRGVVRAAEGSRRGIREGTARVRKLGPVERQEAKYTARGAAAINRKYGVGGEQSNTKRGRLAQTKFAQRATARAQQRQRNILLGDQKASRVNIDANRSASRTGYAGVLRNRQGQRVNESGAPLPAGAPPVPSGRNLTGDSAEIEFLTQILESETATGEEQSAAVSALLAVHSSNGDAVVSVNNFMTNLENRADEDSRAGDLRNRILDDVGGQLYSIPQLAFPNDSSTVARLDAPTFHSLKTGSISAFMRNKSAGDAAVDRVVSDANEGGSVSQYIRTGSVAIMYTEADEEQRAKLESQFTFRPKVRKDDNGNEMRDNAGNLIYDEKNGLVQYEVVRQKRPGSHDRAVQNGESPPLGQQSTAEGNNENS